MALRVSPFAAAFGAGAGDVTVGEEDARLLVVVLHGALLGEPVVVMELQEEVGCGPGVHRRSGARIDVERNAEPLERLLYDFVVFVHYVLRGDAFATGLDGNGDSVFVGTAYPDHVAPPFAEVADIDVRRHVDSGQVADVDGAVGVGQGRSDQIALVFFHFAFLGHCIATKLSFIFDLCLRSASFCRAWRPSLRSGCLFM